MSLDLTSPPPASGSEPPGQHALAAAGATRHLLLQTIEGRILVLGLALLGLVLASFATASIFYPDQALIYGAMGGLNLTIGRAAGMSFGYASGLGHAQVIPLNMIIESIQVLVVYPLFALTWTHLIDTPRWNALMERMGAAAESHRDAIERYGIIGLFFFVFTPFWMTGPVVGSIIGFLIGLRARVNLGIVLSATYVAIGVWALLLNELHRWAATYNRLAPMALVLALVLLGLSSRLLRRLPHPHARPR